MGRSLPWVVLALVGAVAFCLALSGCLEAYTTPGDTTMSGGTGAPADMAGSTAQQHCADTINMYRAMAGVAPMQLDAKLSTFATAASQALANGGAPHQYFIDAANGGTLAAGGFCGGAAENQAPNWPVGADLNAAVDDVLAAMMAEGPGGGHHDNIVSPMWAIVGVGLVVQGGRLSFTNDFSPACR